MRTLIASLIVMLFSGIAFAQVNKTDPPTQAIPAPGTPIIENATQKINKEEARDVNSATNATPRVNTPPSTTVRAKDRQPERREAPVNTNSVYPGYPTAQKPLEPGTGTTTAPTTGTNNQINTLPASNTTNQGKLP